ncbi:hypothetical protein AGMMS50267_15210 [Spirochaetia bacterium]|nr:hypothetical protein AGMMS50267_15210 [Spirochaetia bacterium]
MGQFDKTIIGKPEQWLIEAAADIGLDFSKLIHEMTNELISHSMKRHGDPKTHGTAAIVMTDFKRIPGIIKEPDYAIIGGIRKDTLLNAYAKSCDGATFLYFEEVLQGRKNKALRGKTLYRVNKPLTLAGFIKIVTMNKKTDISGAKKIATGGHPGG